MKKSIRQTPIQKLIERTVTNGEGFRDSDKRKYKTTICLSPIELQLHLAKKSRRLYESREFMAARGHKWITNFDPHSLVETACLRRYYPRREIMMTFAVSKDGKHLPYLAALYTKPIAA